MNTNPLFMTKEDRDEVRELLSDILRGHNERVEGRYNVIHENLVQIKEQTTKTNGRVTVVEKEVRELKLAESTHAINCPHSDKISNLQTMEISRKAILKFLGIAWGITVTVITLAFGLFALLIDKGQ